MSTPIMPGERVRTFDYTSNSDSVTIKHRVEGGTIATYSLNELPDDIRQKLTVFGLKQLLSTRAAADTSVAEKFATFDETIKALKAGVWSEKRGSSTPSDGLSLSHTYFAEAASLVAKKPVEDITAALLAMEPEARSAYVKAKSGHPQLKAHLATAAAKRASEKAKEQAKLAKAETGDFVL